MNVYKAYVRVPFGSGSTTVVETSVTANDTNSATFLLRGQYGQENLVSIPTLVE